MKDLVESGKAHNCLNSDDSIKRYPKIFSFALVLTFIALVAFAAFLVSDILSLELNSSHDGSTNLTDQGANREPISMLKNENTTANNSSRENTGVPPSSMDGSGTPKRAIASSDNSIKMSNATKRAVIVSTSLDSDSHKSFKKKMNISSKSSPQGTQGTVSPLNSAGKNDSGSSQSYNHSNLSNKNLTLNLSASAPKINVSEIPSNISSSSMPETDLTPDIISPAEPNSGEPSLADNKTSNWAIEPSSVSGNGVQGEPIPPELNWSNSDLHDNNEGFNSGSMEDNILNTPNISDELAEVDSYSSPSGPGSQVAPGSQPSSQVQGAKDKEKKRISNRGKSTKSLKRSTPRSRPVRTRPKRPARDNSRR